MSIDDRFEEIKRLLESTIDEFQTLFQSAGGFEDSRVGNGWAPEKVAPEIYYLQPKPLEELVRIAEGRKRSLIDRTIRHLITGAIFVAVTVSVLVSVGLLTSVAFNLLLHIGKLWLP